MSTTVLSGMGKISMARRVIFTVVCGVALLMRKMGADALCAQPSMYIETTKAGLPISGCFKNTTYAGLYETTVWTMDGSDISSSGTTAVVADLVRKNARHDMHKRTEGCTFNYCCVPPKLPLAVIDTVFFLDGLQIV